MTPPPPDPYFGAVILIVAFPAALIGLALIAALCRVAIWATRLLAGLLRK